MTLNSHYFCCYIFIIIFLLLYYYLFLFSMFILLFTSFLPALWSPTYKIYTNHANPSSIMPICKSNTTQKNTLFTQSTCPTPPNKKSLQYQQHPNNKSIQQIHHRSIADGQSQHSFSNNSHRGYLGTAFPSNLVNSRPELRQSRQSLAAPSERMSRASYAGSIHGGPTSVASSTRRSRPRSRSRDQLNATHIHNHRPGSR